MKRRTVKSKGWLKVSSSSKVKEDYLRGSHPKQGLIQDCTECTARKNRGPHKYLDEANAMAANSKTGW